MPVSLKSCGLRTLLALVLLALWPALDASAKPKYVMGVISPRHPQLIQEAYQPLKGYLEKALDCSVTVDPVVRYDDGLKRMQAGKWDLAFATNDTYLTARAYGFRALVMVTENGQDHYKSIVVVRADSPITRVADLKGKHVAFVSRKSASGYLYPMKVLLDQKLSPASDMRVSFTGNVGIIGRGVAFPSPYGVAFDAGAVFDGFMSENPEIAKHLRVLAESEPIPHIPVIVGPGIARDTGRFQSFQQAFLQAGDRAPQVFKPEGVFFDGFRKPQERLYEQVLAIRGQVQAYEKRHPMPQEAR